MAQSHPSAGPSGATDFAQGAPNTTSPLSQSVHRNQADEPSGDQRGYQLVDNGVDGDMRRTNSTLSQSHTLTPSRGGTLKKKQSVSRKGSLKRASSRRSSAAGSVRSVAFTNDGAADGGEMNSAFYTPVPTSGNPTEILANRFQAWRKVLKDLITYFRDIQKSYDARSKSLYTLSNVINNITAPPAFLTEGGIGDATHILRDFHKQSINEGNKAKTIEEEVVVQLTGLRSDLQQKIKEIKSLSGDFKNSVDKETEGTRKAVRELQESLEVSETQSTSGKGDPFIVKLAVERQLERQIEEENYLHRAFLNLESSGRELESIVVGEIQKAYNAYAAILSREADEAYDAVEKLRNGPIAMAKDHEWDSFVEHNEHFVNPRLPIRRAENIHYPGRDNPAALEVRAGMLERKSKYLKSYTPGWYVLSPTHLHEFKSPDRITSQAPLMSLNLAEQKLGSHSSGDSSSHKFMLKGRQSGGMHRGHSWVFRAESYDTMLAWFEDIKNLTEKTGAERTAFIRRHARSVSGNSEKPGSVSSDGGMDEDEADQVPYSATASLTEHVPGREEKLPERPNPGGRFPSALSVGRNSQMPLEPSSPSSSDDRDTVAAAGALPGTSDPFGQPKHQIQSRENEASPQEEPHPFHQRTVNQSPEYVGEASKSRQQDGPYPPVSSSAQHSDMPERPKTPTGVEYSTAPVQSQGISSDGPGAVSYGSPQQPVARNRTIPSVPERHDSTYGDWMGPAAASTGGAAIGAAGIAAYRQQKKQPHQDPKQPEAGPQTVPQPSELAAQTTPTVESTPAPLQNPVRREPSEVVASPISTLRGDPSFIQPHSSTVESPTTSSDPAAPLKALASETDTTRPKMPMSQGSVGTISDLHVPGEFPRTRENSTI